MGAFETEVALRWSDMDAFGHVNHAATITLLEQARVELLFGQAHQHELSGMAEGLLVAKVVVDYHTPLVYTADSGNAVRVRISVRELRAASFLLDYAAYAQDSTPAATARTRMVPFDLRAGQPRRLSAEERRFLDQWRVPSAEPECDRA